ncbi:DUF5454 family protein [Mycoplasma sp. E35C]|uniref:DUF5454 family protein n=1 Tax=Mycoplasma sp. E35C TaxID=2801918 RepID=UPI0021034702|nr:DUF5454 family protein [Mycoplasma sp. E35C]
MDQSLTRQALYDNISKWEAFLQGYKSFYGFDFEWSKYIKDCKLYYGYFDIHSFIKTYGKECEEDFKRFKASIAQKKQEEENKQQAEQDLSKELFNVYDQLFYADSLRVRLLINLLNPKNSYEKKELKRSWKNAKAQGYTKQEWMKTLLNIPFKKGEVDPIDFQYDKHEVFKILDEIKQVKKDYLNKSLKQRADKFSTNKISHFEQEINQASLVVDFHNDFATRLMEQEERKKTREHNLSTYHKVISNYPENNNETKNLTNPIDVLQTKTGPVYQAQYDALFDQRLDEQLNEIKSTSKMINDEFKKAEAIRKQSELEYQKTRQLRENLTKEIEHINESYVHKKR